MQTEPNSSAWRLKWIRLQHRNHFQTMLLLQTSSQKHEPLLGHGEAHPFGWADACQINNAMYLQLDLNLTALTI